MRKLLIVMLVSAAVSIPAALYSQVSVVQVEIGAGEICPSGWTTVDRSWSRPEKVFYVLPASLVAAYQLTHIRGWSPEFQVTPAFVSAVFPTDQLREAAFTSGRLRSAPATSGTVRTCSLP